MTYQLLPWVWPSALTGVCAFAASRGGPEARRGAAWLALNWLASRVVFQARSEETQWGMMLLDVGLLAAFAGMALKSRRHWPMAAASLTLLMVVTHLLHAADLSVSGWAYQTMNLVWSYLLLGVIAYGASTRGPPGDPA